MDHLLIQPSKSQTWSCCKWKQQSVSLGSGPVCTEVEILLKTEKVYFPFLEAFFFFFPLLHASAFLANFPNDLRQTYNLLACSPAKAPDPKRIREDSQCFLLPLLMPFLPVLPLATSMLMASIFLFAYLACGKEPPGFLRSERTGLLVKPVG